MTESIKVTEYKHSGRKLWYDPKFRNFLALHPGALSTIQNKIEILRKRFGGRDSLNKNGVKVTLFRKGGTSDAFKVTIGGRNFFVKRDSYTPSEKYAEGGTDELKTMRRVEDRINEFNEKNKEKGVRARLVKPLLAYQDQEDCRYFVSEWEAEMEEEPLIRDSQEMEELKQSLDEDASLKEFDVFASARNPKELIVFDTNIRVPWTEQRIAMEESRPRELE